MIKANVHKQIANFSLHADFEIPGSGVTALFGRSGSGKSTLLHWIAGLSKKFIGDLKINDEVWEDSQQRIFLPSHQRAVGYIFQDAELFPHLDVMGNIRYGFDRIPANEIKPNLNQVIELLGLRTLLHRSPLQLSGGEKQRVAIARSLLCNPKLLLLDEPLASLDVTSKREILPYLERIKHETKIPMLYVSHSLDEVTRLADHVVQIENGKILASGPLHEILPSLKNCAKSVELGPRYLPQAISFLGDSGTGKTTLIEAIIPILKSRGYKVGVIKHDAHQFNIDHPGKDSYRFTQAGADSMVIASTNQLALVSQTSRSIPVEEIIERYFSDFDIVLTEGYKSSSLAKILVMRANYSGLERFKEQLQSGKVVAVASDVAPDCTQCAASAKFVNYLGNSDSYVGYNNQSCADSPIPTIDLNQPALLAHFIEHNFLNNSNSSFQHHKSKAAQPNSIT